MANVSGVEHREGRVRDSTNWGAFEERASRAFAPLRLCGEGSGTGEPDLRAARVGDLVVAHIAAGPMTVRRDRDLIGSGDRELIKVAWHRSGRAGVEQADRRCRPRPGELVAYDTARPYSLPFWDPYEIVVIGIPQAVLGPSAGALRQRVATPLPADAGLGGLLAAVLGAAPSAVSEAAPAAREHLGDALLSLVLSVFTGASADEHELGSDLFERVREYCLANLHDPRLCLATVAAAHHVSVRYLHKLAGQHGVRLGSWIRRQRLDRIRADLEDPAQAHRTPAALARRWGVLDARHLGRALRAEFGCTPTQIREDAGL